VDRLEIISRFVHASWVGFQIGAGQPYNAEPDENDLRSNEASFLDFLANPGRTPEDSHQLWMAQKLADGWVYGPVKDREKKTHPDLVPFDQLPEIEQRKDINHIEALKAAVSIFWELR
jgi:hypothetical protein